MITNLGLFFLVANLVAGCTTTKRDLSVAPELLSASGTVKSSPLEHNNKKILIDVKNLAKPEKAQPGASVYVVWVQPFELPGAPPQNIGRFNVNDDLNAEFSSSTSHQKFDVFVTAEPSGESVSPSGKKALWARIE